MLLPPCGWQQAQHPVEQRADVRLLGQGATGRKAGVEKRQCLHALMRHVQQRQLAQVLEHVNPTLALKDDLAAVFGLECVEVVLERRSRGGRVALVAKLCLNSGEQIRFVPPGFLFMAVCSAHEDADAIIPHALLSRYRSARARLPRQGSGYMTTIRDKLGHLSYRRSVPRSFRLLLAPHRSLW